MPKFYPAVRDYRDRTIMVVMPHPWKGGFFRVAAALCNALDEMVIDGSRMRVILGVPQGYECTEKYLLNADVTVEQIGYDTVDVADERYVDPERFDRLNGLPLITPARTLPYGDTGVLGEVDAYILLSALFAGVFVSRKPYSIYIADMIQRYVPEIYSDAGANYQAPPWILDRSQRAAIKEADAVFSTTEQTMKDVLHYGGADPQKAMLFPMFAMDIADRQGEDLVAKPSTKKGIELKDLVSKKNFRAEPGQYFLWVTNANAHKNHLNAFRALKYYYEYLGGELQCIICGPVTDLLVPGNRPTGQYHMKVYEELSHWPGYNEHVKVLGYVSDQRYLSLLNGAKFLWHNVIYDNGTFSIIEAASVGTPVLSSDYPQIRFIDETFNVGSSFFDARDPVDAARKIRDLECHSKRRRARKVGGVNQELFRSSLAALVERMFDSAEQRTDKVSGGKPASARQPFPNATQAK